MSTLLLITALVVGYGLLVIMLIIMVGVPAWCIVRFVSAIFSPKARLLIKSQPIAHTIWALGTLLFVAAIGYPLVSDRMPSDKNLVDYFNAHESTYTTLVGMLNDDKHIALIYPDQGIGIDTAKDPNGLIIIGPPSDYGVQTSRFEAYKNLLTSVGATFERKENGALHFSKGYRGISNEERWSYCWLATPPPVDLTIDNVDHFKESIQQQQSDDRRYRYVRYRLIKGNWYIVVAQELGD